MRAILEGLAEPHSSMPYVQVGFRIVLYIVSLLVGSTVDDLCSSLVDKLGEIFLKNFLFPQCLFYVFSHWY
jgi:hypothetical protein